MRRLIVFVLTITFSFILHLSCYSYEDFHIVTVAPIPVGGGIIRYYQAHGNKSTAIRYSYAGAIDNYIILNKFTQFGSKNSQEKEFVKVPIENQGGIRTGLLKIGSRNVQLSLNKYNRVIAKEIN